MQIIIIDYCSYCVNRLVCCSIASRLSGLSNPVDKNGGVNISSLPVLALVSA